MPMIKKLSFDEVALVNGGGNNGQNASDRNYGGSKGSASGAGNGGIYNGVDSCGAGIMGGAFVGSLGGPFGMFMGSVGGAIAGGCTKDSFSNRANSGNQTSNDFGGQCRW